jgi:hypothetical protein
MQYGPRILPLEQARIGILHCGNCTMFEKVLPFFAFLRSDQGKTILDMASMKFVMKQDSSTIDSFVNAFQLSPEQRAFLLEAKDGEGLFSTKSWTQMEVVASPMEAVMADITLVSLSHIQPLVDDKS